MEVIKTMNADEGVKFATSIIKNNYLADLMPGENHMSKVTLISNATSHTLRNGKPLYFTKKQVEDLQDCLGKAVSAILAIRILSTPQSQEEYPYCYGDDYVSKFKVLRKVLCLPYLFTTLMGKNTRWMKGHLSDKPASYYNKFTDEELEQINSAIRTMAIQLASIKLQYQEPEQAKEETETKD